MPPICIAIRLPFVSQYFWENLGVVVVTGMFPIFDIHSRGFPDFRQTPSPEGPKIEKIQDFPPGLKILSDQSQIENFNRD